MQLLAFLGLVQAITSLISWVQEGERTVRALATLGMIFGGFFLLHPVVRQVRELIPSHSALYVVLSLGLTVIGLLQVLKIKNRVVGTCCVFSSALIGLESLGAVHW